MVACHSEVDLQVHVIAMTCYGGRLKVLIRLLCLGCWYLHVTVGRLTPTESVAILAQARFARGATASLMQVLSPVSTRMAASASETGVVYSIQSEEAYDAAVQVGAVRASFRFAKVCYRLAYAQMPEHLEHSIGHLPAPIGDV